jgi:GH15 family glucan-1,4-alpha-glucosidase
VEYWIAVGENLGEVTSIREFVINDEVPVLLEEIEKYWKNWIKRKNFNLTGLGKKTKELFKKSLLIIKAQTDNHGAIIAANDTHTFHFKKDTYSYMWPRDGALVARSLDRAGHQELTEKFFRFCTNLLTSEAIYFQNIAQRFCRKHLALLDQRRQAPAPNSGRRNRSDP